MCRMDGRSMSAISRLVKIAKGSSLGAICHLREMPSQSCFQTISTSKGWLSRRKNHGWRLVSPASFEDAQALACVCARHVARSPPCSLADSEKISYGALVHCANCSVNPLYSSKAGNFANL